MSDREGKRMEQELEEHEAFVQQGIRLGLLADAEFELTPREAFTKSVLKANRAATEAKQELLSWAYQIPSLGTHHRVFSAMFTLDHVQEDLNRLLRELVEFNYVFGGVPLKEVE
ncbi:MAG: hypothetical protein KAY24_00385 [Candidatus Eisenbacteria sp.]|nr:hypothetical protein [Candidatus Eisenbacteria bacterium]